MKPAKPVALSWRKILTGRSSLTKMYGILARIHTGLEYEFTKSPHLEKVGSN